MEDKKGKGWWKVILIFGLFSFFGFLIIRKEDHEDAFTEAELGEPKQPRNRSTDFWNRQNKEDRADYGEDYE